MLGCFCVHDNTFTGVEHGCQSLLIHTSNMRSDAMQRGDGRLMTYCLYGFRVKFVKNTVLVFVFFYFETDVIVGCLGVCLEGGEERCKSHLCCLICYLSRES